MACTNCQPRQDTTGRFRVEPSWPQGGMVSRELDDRRFEVQAFTGRPVSTVPAGRWNRGTMYRFQTPEVHPNMGPLYMNDPTDPTRFVTVVSKQRRMGLLPARKKKGRRG